MLIGNVGYISKRFGCLRCYNTLTNHVRYCRRYGVAQLAGSWSVEFVFLLYIFL